MDLHMREFDGTTFGMYVEASSPAFRRMKRNAFTGEIKGDENMSLEEAKRILTLVANDPDHGDQGAYEDQDAAARVVLAELARLEQENMRLQTNGK